MKKVALILALVFLCLSNLIGLEKIVLTASYENCTSFDNKIKVSVGTTTDSYNILISEYSLKKLDIDVRIGHEKDNSFFWTGLVNTSYSYGLGGFTGLGFLANCSLKYGAFRLKLGAGVQAAVSYGPYQEKALFAFTPLVEGVIGVEQEKLIALIYLSFADPYERDWKAVPTIGLQTIVSISNNTSITANLFVKYAEYLVDPVTLIMAYGFRLGCTINYEGQAL